MVLNHLSAAARSLRRFFLPVDTVLIFLFYPFCLLPLPLEAQIGTSPLVLIDYREGIFELSVTRIEAEAESPRRVAVSIAGRIPGKPDIQVLAEPSRLVVDLPGFSLKSGKVFSVTDSSPLLKLRLGSHKDKVRMVLDFDEEGMPPYRIESSSSPFRLIVDLAPGKGAVMPAPVPVTAVETPAAPEEPAVAATKESSDSAAVKAPDKPTPAAPVVKAVSPLRLVQTEAAPPPLAADIAASPAAAVPQEAMLAPREETAKKGESKDDEQAESEAFSPQDLLRFSVDRVYVAFETGARPVQNVVAKSRHDKPLYITAGAQRVLNPGTARQTIEPTEDLVVSPRRFELEPGGERTLRLLLKKPAASDEVVYRIVLLPQADSFERQIIDVKMNGELRKVDVITGLVMNVVSRPAQPSLKITWKVDGEELIVTNAGNTEVLLESGQFCPEEQEQCYPVPSKRLYAGNSFGLRVPEPGVFRFMKRHGEEFQQLVMTVK